MREQNTGSAAAGVSVPARITLFGFSPVEGGASIEPRSVQWRMRTTLTSLGVALLIAPLLALVPPHAPWALGALGVGAATARRKWLEVHSLRSIEGTCPRCGSEVSLAKPVRLRHPHTVPCDGCKFELSVHVETAIGSTISP